MKHPMHATVGYVLRLLTDPSVSESLKREIVKGDRDEAIAALRACDTESLVPCGQPDCASIAEHAEL